MPGEKRRIIWHCAAGHDFEVQDELRRSICPICGGTEVQRVLSEKERDRSQKRSARSWFWR
jgi:predicted  nucleic acid-binding Zn-ribbon protein